VTPRRYRSIIHDSSRWDGFDFRPDDIVISTPPKCGTTWMQMICALLIFQSPKIDRPLAKISPWVDMQIRPREEVFALLEAQQHRRFIKSHTPLDGLPSNPEVTYIGVARDPRDAGISMFNHFANLDMDALMAKLAGVIGPDDLAELMGSGPPPPPKTEAEGFLNWVQDPTPLERHVGGNLTSLLHHAQCFWDRRDEPNIVLVHYADLQSDLEGEMRRLASRLGIAVSEAQWPELVEAAGFQQMRDRADELMPNSADAIFLDARTFFHRGQSGQWRTVLGPDELAAYEARLAEINPDPELSAWLHRGA
jgi:hypothetical protein